MAQTTVVIDTNFGSITLSLDAERAPKTVANFLSYVDSGHYQGTIFHRVIDGFMAQGGGYDQAYDRKPTSAPVQNEADNGLKNLRGTVAMARTSDPHSATAQFLINGHSCGLPAQNPFNHGFRVSIDCDIRIVRREDKLPSVLRSSNRFNDLIDDLVIEILLWLIDDKRAMGLIHKYVQKCRCLLTLRSLPEFNRIPFANMKDLDARPKDCPQEN